MREKGHTLRSRELDPALPELERMLTTTAGARVKESKQGFGRRIVAGRVPRRAATIALACLAFGGTAVAAGVWDPPIGTDVPNEGGGSALEGAAPPAVAATPVPAGFVEALGILRRAPTDLDRSAEVEATLADVSFVDGVRPDSVRFLAPGDRGQATILLSTEKSIESFFGGKESICVFRPGAFGYGHASDVPGSCFGLSKLLSGRGYTEMVDAPSNHGFAFGLVPDGVASVTAEFADSPSVTVAVSDNYFELPMSGAQLGQGGGDLKGGVQRVVWRDADGGVVPQQPDGESRTGEPVSTSERLSTGQ